MQDNSEIVLTQQALETTPVVSFSETDEAVPVQLEPDELPSATIVVADPFADTKRNIAIARSNAATSTPARADQTAMIDPTLRQKAFSLFLAGGPSATFENIALECGVTYADILDWAREQKWVMRKKEVEETLLREEELRVRALIIKHRAPIIERHIRMSEKLDEKLEAMIEKLDTNGTYAGQNLRRLAETLKQSSDVASRAAAIEDKPFTGGNQKQAPIIIIGAAPKVATTESSTVIDIS